MPQPEIQRGDVVWIPFTYSDLMGGKTRPALIVSTHDFFTTLSTSTLGAKAGKLSPRDLGSVEGILRRALELHVEESTGKDTQTSANAV